MLGTEGCFLLQNGTTQCTPRDVPPGDVGFKELF